MNVYSPFIQSDLKLETTQLSLQGVNGYINCDTFIHTMDYYTALTSSQLLILPNNLNESQNHMLSKRSKNPKEYTISRMKFQEMQTNLW